jgi:hypothetical protein
MVAHCAGSGIGQQVDENVFGFEREGIVPGGLDGGFALFGRGQANGFNNFDTEWFGGMFGHGLSFLLFGIAQV